MKNNKETFYILQLFTNCLSYGWFRLKDGLQYDARAYVTSHYVASRRIVLVASRHVTSHHVTSRHVTSRHVALRRVMSLRHIVNQQITTRCNAQDDTTQADARIDSSSISASLALRPTNQISVKKHMRVLRELYRVKKR